eukprot:975038-Alexandrium_andersonii.AAC.1
MASVDRAGRARVAHGAPLEPDTPRVRPRSAEWSELARRRSRRALRRSSARGAGTQRGLRRREERDQHREAPQEVQGGLGIW